MARSPSGRKPPAPAPAKPRAPRKAGRPSSARSRKANTGEEAPPEKPTAAERPASAPAPEAETPALPDLEALSLNLAKAAMTAQAALAESLMAQSARPGPAQPDPFNVVPAMSQVMGGLAARPDRLFQAQADLFNRYMELWASTTSQTVSAPSADKRFKDPAWSDNPLFDVMRRSYQTTADWMNQLVSSVEEIDPRTRRRAEFFTKLLTDAFSPSNFLASNPVALKALAETNGESLVKGMQNFAADMERGGGRLKISQADYGRFEVGVNVATAPGRVVWRDDLFELIHYAPATPDQHQVPLLIFPPWINKFYILDLQPQNSMIRWLSEQGISVFVCSWVNPDVDKAGYGFADYLEQGLYRAIDKVREQCGTETVNTVGYCIGGTLMGMGLAHMAQTGRADVGATTFFAAQHDFAEAGDLLLFTDEHWLAEIERMMDEAGGVLPGSAMADTFNALRANDLVWSFFVSNYLMGKAPPAFDLLFWNADQTRMPKALHMAYLRRLYGENALARGEMEIEGVPLDLSAVRVPLYFQASREDHIAPTRSVYRSARAFSGAEVTLTLAGSGHIAGVINPPSARKYGHWTNPALPDSFDAWLDGAQAHEGSWWPHWSEWLKARSGPMVPARDPATGPLAPLDEAPGQYVKVRS